MGESPLDRFLCPSDATQSTSNTLKSPLEDLSSSSQVDKRFSFPENSVSPNTLRLTSTDLISKERSKEMELTSRPSASMDHSPVFHSSNNDLLHNNNIFSD